MSDEKKQWHKINRYYCKISKLIAYVTSKNIKFSKVDNVMW